MGRGRIGRLCREGGRRHEPVPIDEIVRGGLYEVLEQVGETNDNQNDINAYILYSKRVQHGDKIDVLSTREFN